MKKAAILIVILLVIIAFVFLVYPYKIKRVCFGDVCPANGGLYLLYTKTYTKGECLAKGAYPVEGIGWVAVYAGCSPIDHRLAK